MIKNIKMEILAIIATGIFLLVTSSFVMVEGIRNLNKEIISPQYFTIMGVVAALFILTSVRLVFLKKDSIKMLFILVGLVISYNLGIFIVGALEAQNEILSEHTTQAAGFMVPMLIISNVLIAEKVLSVFDIELEGNIKEAISWIIWGMLVIVTKLSWVM